MARLMNGHAWRDIFLTNILQIHLLNMIIQCDMLMIANLDFA